MEMRRLPTRCDARFATRCCQSRQVLACADRRGRGAAAASARASQQRSRSCRARRRISCSSRRARPRGDLDALLPLADQVPVTRAERRGRSIRGDRRRSAAARPRLALRAVPNPHLALRAARETTAPDGLLVATGSVYLAGIARWLWRAASS
jgi:hypothetical protein